jgi:oligopeptide transport system substrate-binding protein
MRCVQAGVAAFLVLILATTAAGADNIWRRGETADPGSLDPAKTSTVVEEHILDELLEGLVVYDTKGELAPGVAERWDVSASGLVYTFHLRPDARWSNGAPVTADDFVFSFRRLMDPKTGADYANILYTIKNGEAVNTGKLPVDQLGIRALDPATCEITLEHPAPYFLAQLTHLTALPVYPPDVARYGDGFARAGRLTGNGAFTLKSYLPNDSLVLRKNPYFHDAAHVALDGEIIIPLEDHAAALRRFIAGEIDSYDDVPIGQIAYVRSHLASSFKTAPSLGSYFYAFDTRHKPFDDVRVRQALSMVIDREFLANQIWGGTMLPGYSFVPPGIASYGPPSTVSWKDKSIFDREDEAKRLMKAAGYGPDHPLHLTFRTNQSENNKATAIAIADMWKILGVTTEFIITDATTHFAFLASKAPFDVVRSGWFADYPDAQNYLFLGQSDNPGLNYSHFSDPAYDALMHEAASTADAEKRRAFLHNAETILLNQQPYLVLMSYQASNLVSPRLRGWETNIMDHHPGRYISIAP